MSKMTNKKIADLAGVSPAAVSIAMNGRKGISDETREKILKIAKDNNYVTGATSVKLLQGGAHYVAILFRTDAILDDQIFYSEMAIDAMIACRDTDYSIITTFVTGEPGTIKLPKAIMNGDVEGVLICGDQEPGIYSELNRLNIPFVILDSSRHKDDRPAVFVDYDDAAYTATKHLIELGHRNIAFLSNGALHDFNTLVLDGFQRATRESNIPIYANWMQIDLGSDDSLKECVDRALNGTQKPTAIFCTVDIYAINIIRYLHTCGYRVPEDISVISIDDVLMSKFVIPSLTTMAVDRKQMISDGLDMLDKLIHGEPCKSLMLAKPVLKIRESTAKIKG